jgi:type IV pilus assembly protein PilA
MVAPAPAPAVVQKKLSMTALWGFILTLVGCCIPGLWIIGAILGIVGLVKISKDPGLGGQVLAILALVFVVPAVVVNGIVAAVAIPNFIRYQSRAKESEARTHLRSLDLTVKMKFAQDNKLPAQLPPTPALSEIPCRGATRWPANAAPGWKDLGFQPDGNLRYSYEYIPGIDGQSWTVRATGDLDCDGVPAVFELDSDGSAMRTPPPGVF